MLETIMKYEIIFYVMMVMTAIGVLAKMVSYGAIKKVVKEASEIQKSNHRLMRLVKAKFEHACMVSEQVKNVDAFVRKYLYEYQVFFVRLNSWNALPIKMAWLNLAFGLFGIAGAYQSQEYDDKVIFYIGATILHVWLLVGLHIFADEKTKLKAAQNYMVEYLENVCNHRYEKANQIIKEQEAEVVVEEQAEHEKVQIVEEVEEINDTRQQENQEMRIRAILEEFFA